MTVAARYWTKDGNAGNWTSGGPYPIGNVRERHFRGIGLSPSREPYLRCLMEVMKSGTHLIMALILTAFSVSAAPKACSSAGSLPRLSVAGTAGQLAAKTWPAPPPGARIEGYAVFEVIVSPDGTPCCIKAIAGHPLLLSVLVPTIEHWSFKSDTPFVGVIVVRYSSSGFQLL